MDEEKKDGGSGAPQPSDEEKAKAEQLAAEKAETEKAEAEKAKKAEELSNLNKAILEAQTQLREIRQEKKQIKKEEKNEEEIPQIDFSDPSAKAWGEHIKQSLSPLQVEIETAKEERRTFALQQFLKDKPNLAKNPEKLKELVRTYEKLRNASEITVEGILLDLEKSFAVVYREELIKAARERTIAEAQADALFSDIAVSRGSTTHQTQRETLPDLKEEDKAILAKWGMSSEEWKELKKKYK